MHSEPQAKKVPPIVALFLLLGLLGATGCQRERPSYTPGLGEIMTLTQMRHAKLWFAGHAENWALAAYEVDELEEGFADAMEYHPRHKTSPVDIAQTIPLMTAEPLKALRAAIAGEDAEAFNQAFDSLTKACNACHQATDFGFNVVTRPAANTFANQDFIAPASKD